MCFVLLVHFVLGSSPWKILMSQPAGLTFLKMFLPCNFFLGLEVYPRKLPTSPRHPMGDRLGPWPLGINQVYISGLLGKGLYFQNIMETWNFRPGKILKIIQWRPHWCVESPSQLISFLPHLSVLLLTFLFKSTHVFYSNLFKKQIWVSTVRERTILMARERSQVSLSKFPET